MSRGLGRVQRTIVGTLTRGLSKRYRPRYTIRSLAQRVYERAEPTEAQLSAVRRAVRGLVTAGLVAEADDGLIDHRDRHYVSTAVPPRHRRRVPNPRIPRGPVASVSADLSVEFTAACDQCGNDATWTHTWDDRYVVDCSSCGDGKRFVERNT